MPSGPAMPAIPDLKGLPAYQAGPLLPGKHQGFKKCQESHFKALIDCHACRAAGPKCQACQALAGEPGTMCDVNEPCHSRD